MAAELVDLGLRPRYVECVEGRAEETVPLPADLPPVLAAAVRAQGRTTLFSHQAAAYAAVRAGQSLALTTPTASGKSLAALPLVAMLLEQPGATVVFLFSMKQLLLDQRNKIAALLEALPAAVRPVLGERRRAVARRSLWRGGPPERAPRLLLATPEKLHFALREALGLAGGRRFLAGLRAVVLDECHSYSGILGQNLALLLARLRQAAARCGGDPAACSTCCSRPRCRTRRRCWPPLLLFRPATRAPARPDAGAGPTPGPAPVFAPGPADGPRAGLELGGSGRAAVRHAAAAAAAHRRVCGHGVARAEPGRPAAAERSGGARISRQDGCLG